MLHFIFLVEYPSIFYPTLCFLYILYTSLVVRSKEVDKKNTVYFLELFFHFFHYLLDDFNEYLTKGRGFSFNVGFIATCTFG